MTWVPIGPSCTLVDDAGERAPVTGACTAIAFDPTDPTAMYIGTAGGGVWRTRDQGLHWEPLTDATMSLAIGAIAIASTGRIYAATGDGTRQLSSPRTGAMVLTGRGLLVSDDHGATWELLPGAGEAIVDPASPPQFQDALLAGRRSHQLLVMPDSDRHLVLAAAGGAFESTDGGFNWAELSATSSASNEPTSVVFDPDDGGGTLYVGIIGLGVWRRRGAGPFEKLPTGLGPNERRITLALSPFPVTTPSGPRRLLVLAAEDELLGGISHIMRSRDGGDSWEDVRETFTDVTDRTNARTRGRPVIAVDPDDAETIYLGATHLYRRKQATARWERLGVSERLHHDQLALAFDPHATAGQPRTLWLGNAGGVWRSNDRGDSWAHRNRGLQTALLHSLSTYPGAAVGLAGSQDNSAQGYVGHPLWRRLHASYAETPMSGFSAFDTAIDPRRPGHWYYGAGDWSGQGNPILQHSTDGGRTFHEIGRAVVDDNAVYYRRFVLVPDSGGDRATVVFAGHTVAASRSAKEGWTTLVADPHEGLSATAANQQGSEFVSALTVFGSMLFLGTSEGVYEERVLEDGRLSARFLLKAVPAGVANPTLAQVTNLRRVISSIAVSEDRTEGWLTVGARRSVDMPDRVPLVGPSSLPLSRVQSLKFGAPRTDIPFPVSLTPPVWVPRGQGTIDGLREAENPANLVVEDPLTTGRLFLACDVGLFRSEDRGMTWELWSRGLPNAVVTDIAIEADEPVGRSRMIRVATYGRGAWERSIDAREDDASPQGPQLYLRPHAGFTRRPLPDVPAAPAAHEERLFEGPADLKIQRKRKGEYPKPRSTETYAPDGRIDYIGFELLGRKKLKRATEARIHVQVHNRGPGVADSVAVHLFWAAKPGAAYPALPTDFWDGGVGLPMNTDVWHPIGAVETIDRIVPAEPRVATFDWTAPADVPKSIALLAIVTSPGDPIARPASSPFDVQQLASTNDRVLLTSSKVSGVSDDSGITAGDVLKVLGVAVLAGAVVYGTYRVLDD